MKKVLLTVGAVFVLSFFVVAFIYRHNIDVKAFAQSETTKNADCTNKKSNSENSNAPDKSKTDEKCDFTMYKTLKVRSLKINSLPQPKIPPEEKEKKIKGCVPVKILVDEKGNVSKSCAMVSDENSQVCPDRIENDLYKNFSVEAAAEAKFDVSQLSLGNNEYFELTIIYRFTSTE